MPYRCPLCHHPLVDCGNGLGCAQGHRFDRAREGYVHLLPANRKGSRMPGDDKAMIQARRRFLDAGHYQALTDALTAMLVALSPRQVVDIGCGEGHFTQALAAALPDARIHGIDISKYAIKRAAKSYPQAEFCVASNRDLPFADNSADVITRIYAPSHSDELERVLAPGGSLVIASPGPQHLLALRQRIYDKVNQHQDSPQVPAGLTLVESQRVIGSMTLAANEAADLLEMTPFGWHASDELKQALAEQEHFTCETDFIIQRFA